MDIYIRMDGLCAAGTFVNGANREPEREPGGGGGGGGQSKATTSTE